MQLSFGFRFLVYFCVCIFLIVYLTISNLRKEWMIYKKIAPRKTRKIQTNKYRNLAHQYALDYHIGFFSLYPNENMISATSAIPKCIIFTNIWCICINHEADNNGITEQAFLQTLGHELAHKDGDYSKRDFRHRIRRNLIPPENRLINWTTEIHHDFKGSVISGNTDIESLIEICKFKMQIKERLGQPQGSTNSHPDWNFRMECLQQGTFTLDTIKYIAETVNCTNTELINELHNFYGDIFLHHY